MNIKLMDTVNWCAGFKVSINEYLTHEFTIEKCIEEFKKQKPNDSLRPVICASVNENEPKAIARLKELGFKRGPTMRNWGHGGRKTWMYFYQIKKREWTKHTGLNHDWDY